MLALGLRVTLNTDDPSISDTTLTDEYLLAMTEMGIPIRQIRQMVFYAVDAAFLPEEERRALQEVFAEWEHIANPICLEEGCLN